MTSAGATYPEGRETKAKIHYWDYIKIKNLCTMRETINKTKRQPMAWEKIFSNSISDKGLVSKIYKELIQLNTQKTINLNKTWHKIRTDIFPKKTYRWPTDT